MDITDAELDTLGYRLAGTVHPDPTPLHFRGSRGYGLFRVDITWPAEGWVSYIHVLEQEFKKAGKTGDGETFEQRMKGSYNCLRKTIELIKGGRLYYVGESLYHVGPLSGQSPIRYGEDFPWKHRVPVAMLSARKVILWAKQHGTRDAMISEEGRLNNRYRGEWAKEGWTRQKTSDGRILRIRRAAAD